VRIVLSPDQLGTLDLDVRVRKEAVNILMSVQREDTLHSLRGHAADLRAALADQGLRVESLNLQTAGRDFRSDGGPAGGYGNLYDGRDTSGSYGRGTDPGRREADPGPGEKRPGAAGQRMNAGGISVMA
jgi:hypothetical protein